MCVSPFHHVQSLCAAVQRSALCASHRFFTVSGSVQGCASLSSRVECSSPVGQLLRHGASPPLLHSACHNGLQCVCTRNAQAHAKPLAIKNRITSGTSGADLKTGAGIFVFYCEGKDCAAANYNDGTPEAVICTDKNKPCATKKNSSCADRA